LESRTTICPGCGLELPRGEAACDSYYHLTPECWALYTEVLSREYQNAALFGQVHQLTVDAYAVQHAGGPHPDKSVCVHLVGLHLVLERGLAPMDVPPRLQRMAASVSSWPHFAPPARRGPLTVFEVALAGSALEHATCVRAWAGQVWHAWSCHQADVAELAGKAFLAGG
jgi:hypothetical protein